MKISNAIIRVLIGAAIGLIVGGSTGAAIGAVIGLISGNESEDLDIVICPHCKRKLRVTKIGQWLCPFCKNKFSFAKNDSDKHIDTHEKQTVFFVALNSMLAKMAKADGRVSEEEINLLSNFYRKMGFDEEARRAAITIFNNAKNDNFSIYDYAEQYAQVADLLMREMIYDVLWQVALADGSLHREEENILRQITAHLQISSERYYQWHPNYNKQQSTNKFNDQQLQNYYAVLGASPNDSDSELKRKYRKKVSEYHPDKIQAKGLPPQFLKQANEQTAKINAAYDALVAARKAK